MGPAAKPQSDVADAHARQWRRAEGQLQAAQAVACDPTAPIFTARVHLLRGWAELLELAKARSGDDSPIQSLADAVQGGNVPWVPSDQRDLVAQSVAAIEAAERDATDNDDEPTPQARETFDRWCASLVDAVRAAEQDLFGEALRERAKSTLTRRVAIGLAILVPAIVVLALTAPSYRQGPWRGEYFENKQFEGEPYVRRDANLRFKWERMGPRRDMADDQWSARWDTCMLLSEAVEPTWQLVSDDGARLYIDGELIIDNWKTRRKNSRGKQIPLESGVHHIHVEYYDEKGVAEVALTVSLYGERPESIPTRILRWPGEDFDPEAPCADIEPPA